MHKIFRKANISNPLIRTCTCAYQEVRNVCLSENFAHALTGWSSFVSVWHFYAHQFRDIVKIDFITACEIVGRVGLLFKGIFSINISQS